MSMNYNLKARASNGLRIVNKIIRVYNTPINNGKVVVLVEGYYDIPFYSKLLDNDAVVLQQTEGCDNMEYVSAELNTKGFVILVIQDSDFRHFGVLGNNCNHLFTDYHDTEMTCFADNNFATRYYNKLNSEGLAFNVESAFSDIKLLSYYKWYNMKYSVGINFKDNIDGCISRIPLLDKDYIDGKLGCRIRYSIIRSFLCDNPVSGEDYFHLMNGHDFLNRLCFQINSEDKSIEMVESNLQKWLVDTYTFADFQRTNLYDSIVQWEKAKQRKILRI